MLHCHYSLAVMVCLCKECYISDLVLWVGVVVLEEVLLGVFFRFDNDE